MLHDHRIGLVSILGNLGLLPSIRRLRRLLRMLASRELRFRERVARREFAAFARQFGPILALRPQPSQGASKRAALVVSLGRAGVQSELGLAIGLEMAGLRPMILAPPDPLVARYYELAGIKDFLTWDEVVRPVSPATVKSALDGIHSFEQLLAFEFEGIRVGRCAASSMLRETRKGTLDVEAAQVRRRLYFHMSLGMAMVVGARRVLRKAQPDLALFVDRGYTPEGELFEQCLLEGVDTITWNAAHKNNAIMLKRYGVSNRDEHPASLSEASWSAMKAMQWTDNCRQRLFDEIERTYVTGEWYGEVGTQFNKRVLDCTSIAEMLGLDPSKKNAVIFPHILWDGTFFWGESLFRDYEEWFAQTLKAACANRAVNWIIKIHPANLTKNLRDGVRGEPAEVLLVKQQVSELPKHIFLIPADTDINTFALYGMMDYCVTVRGTVGIEAAVFGIPVLTAGTGRYDHKGFTLDSGSTEEYLQRLSNIQEIPSLTPSQRELAQRFAYGVFVRRPLHLETITLEYQQDRRATLRATVNARTAIDWRDAPDLNAFAKWVRSSDADFLSDPLKATHGNTAQEAAQTVAWVPE